MGAIRRYTVLLPSPFITMDHHSSNHDKYRVKLEPDRSPEHGMALLTVDSGSNSGGPLPPPQASQGGYHT